MIQRVTVVALQVFLLLLLLLPSCQAWLLFPNQWINLQETKPRQRPPGSSAYIYDDDNYHQSLTSSNNRRAFMGSILATITSSSLYPVAAVTAWAVDNDNFSTPSTTSSSAPAEILTQVSGDAKKFFNEARALDTQGNIAAAQRLYSRVTQIQPNFIYGWSQLGNTQTVFGDLTNALQSYTTAIDLCTEHNRRIDEAVRAKDTLVSGARRCNDLYIMYLNRGSIRLNTNEPVLALADLQLANTLRGRPDAVLLQNLARAKELNGLYQSADRDYTTAILMTANEVAPFWLRSAMVKYQLGDLQSAVDLLKRVDVKFPEAPEVRAAYAVLLTAQGKAGAGQQEYLAIPNRARAKYVDEAYLTQTIAWPPAMRQGLDKIAVAVGDK